MKTKNIKWIKTVVASALLLCLFNYQAYSQREREKLAVLGIDVHGLTNGTKSNNNQLDNLTPTQMANLVRLEVEKLDSFEVTDRYDANFILKDQTVQSDACFGKIGALEYGKTLKVDLAVTGSVERYADFIVLTLRLVDVNKGNMKKTQVREFLNLPDELQLMVRITLRELLGLTNDEKIVTRLTKQYNYENIVNNPQQSKLNLSGPRMGFTGYTGKEARFLQSKRSEGGYDVAPVMFHFGYQFEVQYLNEGNYQALFEFVPLITGMDQNMIIPSVTILNGLRSNIFGWEFALGPSFSAMTVSKDLDSDNYRVDSRGDYKLRTSFVVAIGKSFKSGKMNIPFNAFVIPAKDGVCFGLSFGYNAKNK